MEFSEEEIVERKRLYESLREHILKCQLSNSENFDKAILSLGSTFLVASLTFTNSIIPLSTAWYLWQLYFSWSAFILAIISTLISYLISQKALKVLLENSEKYYLEGKEEYRDLNKNSWSKWNDNLSFISAFFFISGIIFISLFLYLNNIGGHNVK